MNIADEPQYPAVSQLVHLLFGVGNQSAVGVAFLEKRSVGKTGYKMVKKAGSHD